MTTKWFGTMWWWGAIFATILMTNTAAISKIHGEDLNVSRSVAEGEWLQLKLEVLGLKLSYPAYRIGIDLDSDNRVSFNFWLSAPLAEHLLEGGEGETERVLSYHAEGLSDQVMRLLQDEFPELWPRFDVEEDVKGVFWAPGDEFDSLPNELAHWSQARLYLR